MKQSFMILLLILTNTIGFSQAFESRGLDSLFGILEKNNQFMGSIAISKNGRLIYTKSIGYADVENAKRAGFQTRYRIGSVAKMFTACLILKAVEENRISLSQSLDKYFPEIENSKVITIENLLNHTSGIHDFTNDKTYPGFNTGARSEKQMIEKIASGKSDFVPGSKVGYSNANYIVLSYILEKIYQKKYAAILDFKIIKPLGLKDTYFGSKIQVQNHESHSYHFVSKWERSTETDLSIPMGAGGLLSNASDLTVFIEQLFKGNIISKKMLSVMRSTTHYHGIGVGMGILAFTNFGKKSYGHNGAIDNFKSLLHYFPGEKLSIAITSNGSLYPMDSLLSGALHGYFATPFTMPTFNYIALKTGVLDLYLGQYASQQIPVKIIITKKEKKLFGQVKDQPPFPLEATAENVFRFEQAGIILEFEVIKKQMTLTQNGQKFLFTKE